LVDDEAHVQSSKLITAPLRAAHHVPSTRTSTAWVGICAAAVIAAALIVFMLRNTRAVQISFLGMTASTSLAMALRGKLMLRINQKGRPT